MDITIDKAILDVVTASKPTMADVEAAQAKLAACAEKVKSLNEKRDAAVKRANEARNAVRRAERVRDAAARQLLMTAKAAGVEIVAADGANATSDAVAPAGQSSSAPGADDGAGKGGETPGSATDKPAVLDGKAALPTVEPAVASESGPARAGQGAPDDAPGVS